MSDYANLDLTWTIQRIDTRTPLGRHGREMLDAILAGWERVSRYGVSTGPGTRAGTNALVCLADSSPI